MLITFFALGTTAQNLPSANYDAANWQTKLLDNPEKSPFLHRLMQPKPKRNCKP
ncbi:MAG: hypothetical protein HC817_13815 [Saprospiraceae bacterium]|nr:hypothetical protein [Saprospiraceae bacterium]